MSNEARIYPVFGLDGKKSDYLEPILETLSEANYILQLQTVDYELIKGSNQMLVVKTAGGTRSSKYHEHLGGVESGGERAPLLGFVPGLHL